jgi:hypothetical protein
MSKFITKIGDMIETLYNNVRHIRVRRTVHWVAMNSLVDKLKLFTFFKAALIILFSILQIYVVRKIFSDKGKVNKQMIEIHNSSSNDGYIKNSNIYL